jgi:serine/threonine protein kinase
MTYIHDQILPEGTQLGVYEIKEASQIDTFDITYRAWNHHLKGWAEIQEYFPHDFAIRANDGLSVKSKSPNDKENFEYGLKAFLDQAEILTQIEHPNIVTAENILQFNGTAYLIMDYQEGVPLSTLVRSPASFAETELKFILVSILNALQKVHEYKIVHGGIQPATIILGENGEPLLTDFAVARLAIAAHTAKLAGELAAGYAPPELYEHANESGPATDFYALGATMYYCITHN